jgi:nucleotide-binding universal stress UspA family protein
MTILAAYQQTPEGQAALDRAVAEARLRRTDLVVLTAPAHPGDEPITRLAELDRLLAEDAGGPVPISVRPAHRPEHLADELVDLGSELDAEMIVIGLRKRSPVGKLFLGSAAQDVLLNATVPVLAVRAVG